MFTQMEGQWTSLITVLQLELGDFIHPSPVKADWDLSAWALSQIYFDLIWLDGDDIWRNNFNPLKSSLVRMLLGPFK